jgi:glutamate synthase domain-containing protein 1
MRKEKDISGCGIIGIMNEHGKTFSGEDVVVAICNMMERGNGLGAGFAGYGIYPNFKDYWCFHIMYHNEAARVATEEYINSHFKVKHHENIPTKRVKTLGSIPSLFRYFLETQDEVRNLDGGEENSIIGCVMEINRHIEGSFVFSSGKNMGIFKGVGNPDEIAEFYQIPEYAGYIWTAHNRFPTNYLENFNYRCSLSTDTEVMAYLFDLLVRRHGIDFELVAKILASPFWNQIERGKNEEEKAFLRSLRIIYGSALVNGPFSVVVANSTYMVGLNDRVKLRPLVAARKGNFLYISSEEAAIREVCKDLDTVWMPKAGEPIFGRLNNGKA